MRRRAILAGLAGAVAMPRAAFARCEGLPVGQRVQNADRDLVGLDHDEIVERGWIEFAARMWR